VVTNPGILNPDVVEPIGKPDREVISLLARSADAIRGGFVNFGLHCDTVGGTEMSADWTHYLRKTVSASLDMAAPLLTPINCCGDVNHWNVFKEVTSRGFEETERIGVQVGQAALNALASADPIKPGPVHALRTTVQAATRMPSDAELVEAKAIMAEPAPDDVDFTMDRVNALRKIRAAETGPTLPMDVTVITFGNVALVGIPAEYFSALGRDIKSRSPFEHTVVITLAGKNVGYIGERQNYDEGGYEMTSSIVAPGSGEALADAAVRLLEQAARP